MVLVLLTTGKGKGGSTPHCPASPGEGHASKEGTPPGGGLSKVNWASSPFPGGVGRVAGLGTGKEEKEGATGASCSGLPPAAPSGRCHTPLTVCSQHAGLPAAAACPAAGAGEPWVLHPFSWGTGRTRHDLTRGLLQAAHSLHRVVHRCAMLWKQKVLGQGREPQPLTSTMPSRRVTFDHPLSTRVAAGAGDAALEAKRTRDLQSRGALGSLALAAGDSQLLEL